MVDGKHFNKLKTLMKGTKQNQRSHLTAYQSCSAVLVMPQVDLDVIQKKERQWDYI